MNGTQIRRLRKKKNMKVEELAIRVGVSVRTVYRWERGENKPYWVFIKPLQHVLKGKR